MILNKACFSVVEFFLYLCKITLKFFIAFEVFCYRLCSDTEIFYLDINFKKFNFFEHKCQKIYYYKIKLQQIWILNKQFYNKIRINKRIFFINLALKFSRCCETNLTFFLIYFYEKLNVRIKFLFFSQRHEKKIFLLFRRNYLAHSRSYFFKKFTLLRMCYSFDNFKNSSYNFLKLNLKNYINNLNTYIYTKNIFFSIKIIKCYYVKHRYNLYKFSRFFESYFKNTDLVKKIQQRFRIHFYLLKLFFFHFLCQDIFFLNQIFYFFGDLRTISTTKKYIFCSRKNDWLFYHNKHRTRNMHFQIFSENIDCDVNIKTKRYYFPLEILCRNFPSFFLKLFKKKKLSLKIYKRMFRVKTFFNSNKYIFCCTKKKHNFSNSKQFFFRKIKTRILKFLYFTFLNFTYLKRINLVNLIAYYKKTPKFLWIIKNFLFSKCKITNKIFYFVLNKLKESFTKIYIQKLILHRPELFLYSTQKKNNNSIYVYYKKFRSKIKLFFHFLICSYDLFNIFFFSFLSNKKKNTPLVINSTYKHRNRNKLCFYVKSLNIIYNVQKQKKELVGVYFIKKKEEKMKLLPIFENLKLSADLVSVFRKVRKKKNNLKFLMINFFKKIFSGEKNIIFQLKMFFIFLKKIYNLKKIVKNDHKTLNCCLFCFFKLSNKYYLNLKIKKRKKFITRELIFFFLKETLFFLNFTKTIKLMDKNITWLFDDILKKKKKMKTNTEYMCFSKFIYLYLFYSFQSKFGFYIAICILISFNLKTYQVFPKNINFIKKFTLLYFLKNFFEYKKEPFVEYIFHFLKKKSFIPKKNQCYGLNFLNSLLLVKTSDICKNFYRKLYLNEISENFKIKNVTKFLKKNKISVYLYRKTRKNSKKKDVYDSKLNTDFAYIFQNYEHFLNSLLAKENIKRIFFFSIPLYNLMTFLYKNGKSLIGFSFQKIFILFYFIFLLCNLTNFSKRNNSLNYMKLLLRKTEFGDFFITLLILQSEISVYLNFDTATLILSILLKQILIDIRFIRYKFLFFEKFIHSNKKKKLYFLENKMHTYLHKKKYTSKKILKNIESGNTTISKITRFLYSIIINLIGKKKLSSVCLFFICFFFKKNIFSLCLNCICIIIDFYFDFFYGNEIICLVYLVRTELNYIKIKNSFHIKKNFSYLLSPIEHIIFAEKIYISLIGFFCLKPKTFLKKKKLENFVLVYFKLKNKNKKMWRILHSISKNYFLCFSFKKFLKKYPTLVFRITFTFKVIYLTNKTNILVKQIFLIKIWTNSFCKNILRELICRSKYEFNVFHSLLSIYQYFLLNCFQVNFFRQFNKKYKKNFICNTRIDAYMMLDFEKNKKFFKYFLLYLLKISFINLKNLKKKISSTFIVYFLSVFSKIKFLFKRKVICLNFLKNIYVINKNFIDTENKKLFLIFLQITLILSKLKTIFRIKCKFFFQFFKFIKNKFLYKKEYKFIIYTIMHRIFMQISCNFIKIGYFKKFMIYIINNMIFSKFNIYKILGVKLFFLVIRKNFTSHISYFLYWINFLFLCSFFLPIKLIFNNIITIYLFVSKFNRNKYKFKHYLFLLLETERSVIRISIWYLILNVSINFKILLKKDKIKFSIPYQDLKIGNLEAFFFTLSYKLLNIMNENITYKNLSTKKVIYFISRNKFKHKTSIRENCVLFIKKNSFQVGYIFLSLCFFKLSNFAEKYASSYKQVYVLFCFLNYKKILEHFLFNRLETTFYRRTGFLFFFYFYQIYLGFFKNLYKGNVKKTYSLENIFFSLKQPNKTCLWFFSVNDGFFFSLKFFCFLFIDKKKFFNFYKCDICNMAKNKHLSFFLLSFLNFLEEKIYLKIKLIKSNTFNLKKNFSKKNRYNYHKHLKNFATNIDLLDFH